MMLFQKNSPFPDPFPEGMVLLIDKPLGWTSFDVVNKLRFNLKKRLGVKKLKVGHAGTLDPLATGLLIVCVGAYTKRIDQFQAMPKTYTGTLTFGATTPSFDREKPVDQTFPVDALHDADIQALIPTFIGAIQQVPPIYSAVKVDGKRLYKNARTGDLVEIEPRTVQIDRFEIGPLRPSNPQGQTHVQIREINLYPDYSEGKQADFEVLCSKGTYIRSLVHDFGQEAGCGAYLSALCRTQIGGFQLADAWDMTELVALLDA